MFQTGIKSGGRNRGEELKIVGRGRRVRERETIKKLEERRKKLEEREREEETGEEIGKKKI